MDIQELLELAKWVRRTVKDVRHSYESVSDTLRHNSTETQKIPLEDHVDSLIYVLNEIDLLNLTHAQRLVLFKLNVEGLFGERGIDFVNSAVRNTNVDPAIAHAQFVNAIRSMDFAKQWASDIINALESLFAESDDSVQEEGKIILRIEFTEKARIDNINDWKKWSDKWHRVLRGIGMVFNQRPDEVQIVGASRGSIIITIAASLYIVKLLAEMTGTILKAVNEWKTLQKTMEELKEKNLLDKDISESLDRKVSDIKSRCVDETLASVQNKYGSAINGEVEAAVKQAIVDMVKFLGNGGKIDFGKIQDIQNEDREIVDEYREIVNGVRRLTEDQKSIERKLDKLIENGNLGEESEE